MAFAVLKDASRIGTDAEALKLEGEIMKVVDDQLGAVARPGTRPFSSPCCRKPARASCCAAIQAVCEGRDPGDLTTIEDPAALQQLKDLLS